MKFIPIFVSIIIAQAAGAIGSIFTAPNIPVWYEMLVKPEWNPPSWVFGPVWISLYTLMGIAAYLIWKKRGEPGAKIALWVYGIHLILNTLWSIIFFGMRNPGLAFMEILVLLASILLTTWLFKKIDWRAAALMLPYIAWVSFASFLNYTIWQLN